MAATALIDFTKYTLARHDFSQPEMSAAQACQALNTLGPVHARITPSGPSGRVDPGVPEPPPIGDCAS
jgi:hypothetical protein